MEPGEAMDTFNFLIAMLMAVLAVQSHQNWIVFGIIVIIILSSRSVTTFLATVIGIGVIYFFSSGGDFNAYLPFIVLAIVILALLIGIGKKDQQPEYYAPDYGGMMGGF